MIDCVFLFKAKVTDMDFDTRDIDDRVMVIMMAIYFINTAHFETKSQSDKLKSVN